MAELHSFECLPLPAASLDIAPHEVSGSWAHISGTILYLLPNCDASPPITCTFFSLAHGEFCLNRFSFLDKLQSSRKLPSLFLWKYVYANFTRVYQCLSHSREWILLLNPDSCFLICQIAFFSSLRCWSYQCTAQVKHDLYGQIGRAAFDYLPLK